MSSGYRPAGCGQDRRHPHPRGSGRRPDADDLATDHQQSMVPVDPSALVLRTPDGAPSGV